MKLSVIQRIDQVDRDSWNALSRDGNPFLSHEFLSALERSGCVEPSSGWEPNHLVLHDDDGTLVGAVPLYLKYHSWGEFVFDWGWADAYQRAGLEYYPKLLCAVPFTPVTGPRLLIQPRFPEPHALRRALADGLVAVANNSGVSSLHILFTVDRDNRALEEGGLMLRTGNQFHSTGATTITTTSITT